MRKEGRLALDYAEEIINQENYKELIDNILNNHIIYMCFQIKCKVIMKEDKKILKPTYTVYLGKYLGNDLKEQIIIYPYDDNYTEFIVMQCYCEVTN